MDLCPVAAWMFVSWLLAVVVGFGNSTYTRQGILHELLFANGTDTDRNVYDSNIAPNFEEDVATTVRIQLYLQNIYSVSEAAMDFSTDLILRQRWLDKRLQYERLSTMEFIELDNKLMNSVWVPDTYFVNEKRASVHDVTVPNKMMHLYRNGTVLYSMRLSLTLSCAMNLQKYPLDEQKCPIIMESYAYTVGNVVFEWADFSSIIIQRNVTMPQFEPYIGTHGSRCETAYGESNFTCLRTYIELRRKMGYYLVQVFVPSVLIVVLSWVSFWVDHDAVPARISLGVLTVLTMTTQSSGARQALPQVSYVKEIDVWMFTCLLFVFVDLLKYSYLNVIVKAIDVWMFTCLLFVFVALLEYSYVNVIVRRQNKIKQTVSISMEPVELHSLSGKDAHAEQESGQLLLQTSEIRKNWLRARRIDKSSRVVFPASFLVFNVIFWVYYIYAPNPE